MAHIHVESIQTAVPTRIALELGRTLPIAVSGPPIAPAELQRRFRAVLYYRDRLEGEVRAQMEQAAWVQEALSAALADHPKMAGRLWRRHPDGGDGLWDVKLCDAGVRLLTASADTTMTAFLEAEDRESKEPALALWTDVDPDDPEKCSPFVMQLTRFQGGGYAIGACCSLLHADPLSLISFLKSLARTHAQLQAQSKLVPNQMINYTRYFRNPGAATKHLRSFPLVSAADDDAATTVLFRLVGDAPDRRALAEACVAQASEKLGVEKPTRFTVLAGDGLGGLNVVRACAGGDGDGEMTTAPSPGSELRDACWDEAGLEEAVLDGCKPVHVSCSIVSPRAEEGLVVVMQAGAGAELLIGATVPSGK